MGVSTRWSGKVWLSLFPIYHKVTKSTAGEWPDANPAVKMTAPVESALETHEVNVEILQD